MNPKESDKARKRREYNRVSQQRFRQRRKEKLEVSQDNNAAQSNEINRMSIQISECQAEIETLKSQVYCPTCYTPSSAPSSNGLIWDTLGTPNPLPANQLALTSAMPPGAIQSTSDMHGMQYPMADPVGLQGSYFDLRGGLGFSMVATSSLSLQAMSMMAAPKITTPLLERDSLSSTSHRPFRRSLEPYIPPHGDGPYLPQQKVSHSYPQHLGGLTVQKPHLYTEHSGHLQQGIPIQFPIPDVSARNLSFQSTPRPEYTNFNPPIRGRESPAKKLCSNSNKSQPMVRKRKRQRRRYGEIDRKYTCGWKGCEKSYGCANHLNAHITIKTHGERRYSEPQV